MHKYQNLSDFRKVYSSSNWAYVSRNPMKAYLKYNPTLYDLQNAFGDDGEKVVIEWVTEQVLGIWSLNPDTDKTIGLQTYQWARIWVNQNLHFKISELMLFFSRCATGKYDTGYGKMNLQLITKAFNEQFLRDRARELDRYEKIRSKKEEDDAQQGGITYDEYKSTHSDFDKSGVLARILGVNDKRQTKYENTQSIITNNKNHDKDIEVNNTPIQDDKEDGR